MPALAHRADRRLRPRTHWRNPRRLRRTASGRSLTYNLRFPGQYYMAETGLSQNLSRDYDPVVGRYIESDPIGLAGGSYSTYAYANGSPITNVDPSGLAPPGRTGTPTIPTLWPPNIALPWTPENTTWARDFGNAIGDAFNSLVAACKSATCPECTPYKKGTIGWTRLDTTHGHYPVNGPHLHLRQVNQRPSDCKCFWNDADPKVAPPPPHPDWVDLSAGEPALSP